MEAMVIEREVDVPTKAPAPIEVRVVNPLEDASWDERLRAFPDATIFHTAGWAAVLHETYGYEPLYLSAHRDRHLAGLLPLMEVRSRFTGTRGVSLPFTDVCPAIGRDPAVLDHLRQQAVDMATSRDWRYLELRGSAHPGGLDSAAATCHVEHVLDLRPGADALFAACHPSHRRGVRRSETMGLCVSIETSLPAVRDYYRLHCLTRRDHGLPPPGFAWFHQLHRHVLSMGSGFVVLARDGGQPIAAAVFLQCGRRATYKYGASDRRQQALRANNRVMWEGIQACIASGAETLSLGKTHTRNQGLLRFKRGWGAAENDLPCERMDFTAKGSRVVNDGVFGWHNHVFRRLPIPVNRLIGACLYPHLG